MTELPSLQGLGGSGVGVGFAKALEFVCLFVFREKHSQRASGAGPAEPRAVLPAILWESPGITWG